MEIHIFTETFLLFLLMVQTVRNSINKDAKNHHGNVSFLEITEDEYKKARRRITLQRSLAWRP
jgi:hypothetical protein